MKGLSKNFLFKILIFISVSLYSFNIKEFRPTTFEFRLSEKERLVINGELPLIDSILIVSKIPIGLLSDYISKLNSVFSSISKDVQGLTQYQSADRALQMLHERLFKTYKENVTSVKETIDNGYFNCVSSSIIYNLLMERLGLKTRGILLKDHVFSQVYIENEWVDVETTVKFGFDPGKKKQTMDDFTKLTRFVYVPPSKRTGREEIVSNFDYLSIMYANIGVEFLNKKDFDEALSYFVKAVIIRDNLSEAVNNIKAGYISYSIHLAENKDFNKAALVLKEILSIYPEFDIAKNNLKSIYINWANYLFDFKKYRDGINILETNTDIIKNEEIKNFYIVWAQNLYLSKNYSEAISVLENYLTKYDDRSIIPYINDIKRLYAEDVIKKGENPIKIIETIRIEDNETLSLRCYLFEKSKQFKKCFDDIKTFARKPLTDDIKKLFTSISYSAVESGNVYDVIDFIKYLNKTYNFDDVKDYYEKIIDFIGFYYYKNNNIENGLETLLDMKKSLPNLSFFIINSGSKVFYQAKLYPLLNKKEYSLAYKTVKEGLALFSSDYLKDVYKRLVSVYASELYKAKKYEDSYNVLLEGLKEFQNDSYIRTNFKTVANTLLQVYKDDKKKRDKIESDLKKYLVE